jgi:hypothetical protein
VSFCDLFGVTSAEVPPRDITSQEMNTEIQHNSPDNNEISNMIKAQ